MLPDWPAGTVAILVTVGETPHAIPVSAVLRAGAARLILGLAESRGSLERIRHQRQVAVVLLAEGVAVTARGRAREMEEPLADGVRAVMVEVDAVDDHMRPTFVLEGGVQWHWTDGAAQARDTEVRDALARLAGAAPER